MSLTATVLPSARTQIVELCAWWREHRPAAANLVKNEFERALTVLADSPNLGQPYPRRGIPGLRRYRLQKTPYHGYYVPNIEAGQLVILAVWSGMRKKGPALKAPT